MKIRLLLVAALTACALVALPASGASAVSGNGKCKLSKKWDVVKRTSDVVVFIIERSSGDVSQSLYACYKKTGARAKLAVEFDDGYVTSGSFDLAQANGRFVAWAASETDISCKADCPPDYEPTTYEVARVDMKNGRTLRWPDAKPEGSALRLSKRGNVAWVSATGTANVFEVRIGDAGGSEAIDTGAIDPASLALRGTALRWTNGGESKSATLP